MKRTQAVLGAPASRRRSQEDAGSVLAALAPLLQKLPHGAEVAVLEGDEGFPPLAARAAAET